LKDAFNKVNYVSLVIILALLLW